MNFSRFAIKWQRRILSKCELESSQIVYLQCRNYVKATQEYFQLASSQEERIESSVPSRKVKVGVVFDIDGVLVRGRKVIPTAKDAIHKLEDNNVPFIYLTNGGCETEEQKSEKLRERLGVEVIGTIK